MKKVLLIIAVLVFIGAIVAVAGIGGGSDVKNDDLASYFQDQMITRANERMGVMPIEGYDAELLLGAYDGLVAEDFEGVEAFEGVYEIQDGEPVFVRTTEQPITSAERTIANEGYATLLGNVTERLDIEIESEEDIDSLIDSLDSSAVVTLGVGDKETAGGVEIEVLEVLEDSRCPGDVECIQQGTIRVKTRISSGLGTAEPVFEPNTPITTEAEEVTMTSVTPYPESTKEIEESDYAFVFVVTSRNTQ